MKVASSNADGSRSDLVVRAVGMMQGPRLARRLRRQHVRILTYHGFAPENPGLFDATFKTPVEAFRSQLRHLKRHYSVVPLRDVVDHLTEGAPLPPNPAVITIDDGYLSAYTLAYPALAESRLPATLFPAIDFVDGKTLMWTDRVKACVTAAKQGTRVEVPAATGPVTVTLGGTAKRREARGIVNLLLGMQTQERNLALLALEDALASERASVPPKSLEPMGWSAIAAMVDGGFVTVGSHTKTHEMMTALTDSAIEDELSDSKRIVESRLGVVCDLFCYPYGGAGAFDDRTAAFVRSAGYRCALTTLAGMVPAGSDPYELRRMGAPDDPARFETAMAGLDVMLTDWKRRLTLLTPSRS